MNEKPITYTVRDNRITVEMSREEFNVLMMAVGCACGAAQDEEFRDMFASIVRRLLLIENT